MTVTSRFMIFTLTTAVDTYSTHAWHVIVNYSKTLYICHWELHVNLNSDARKVSTTKYYYDVAPLHCDVCNRQTHCGAVAVHTLIPGEYTVRTHKDKPKSQLMLIKTREHDDWKADYF